MRHTCDKLSNAVAFYYLCRAARNLLPLHPLTGVHNSSFDQWIQHLNSVIFFETTCSTRVWYISKNSTRRVQTMSSDNNQRLWLAVHRLAPTRGADFGTFFAIFCFGCILAATACNTENKWSKNFDERLHHSPPEKKISPSHWKDLGRNLIHGSLGRRESTFQSAPLPVQFSFTTAHGYA